MSSCAEADWSRWGEFCAGRRARSRARFVHEPLTAAAATSMRTRQSARACMPRSESAHTSRQPTGPSSAGRVRADGGAARQEQADVECEPDVRSSSSRRAHSDSAHSLSSKPTVPCSSRSPRHRTSGGCWWLWLAPATAPGGSCAGSAGGARARSATRGALARWARAGRAIAGATLWWKSTDRFQPSSTPPTISALARRLRCGRATAISDHCLCMHGTNFPAEKKNT